MTGYEFHPEARKDLDEIWEYIRLDSLAAADRVRAVDEASTPHLPCLGI